jgi:peptidoglycan/LPS O-acetylase OafA/YrhL
VAATQLAACGALYASGFVARQVISSRNPDWRGLSFQWLPTNVDLFAVGMAVASLSAWAATDDRLRARLDRLATHGELWWAAGIALFAWYAARVGPADFEAGYRGWFWQQRQLVLGVMTALLLVPVVFGPQRQGVVRRALRCRPVVWVGTVSYGLYLWHFDWMKLVIPNTNGFTGEVVWRGWLHAADGRAPLLVLLAVGLGAGCLFAAMSWSLLEHPLERLKSVVR